MKADFGQLLRYSLVGLANTFFYAGLLFISLKFLEAPRPVSVAAAFVIAMIFQYLANRSFTFRSKQGVGGELLRYLIAALLNYIITLVIIFIAIDFLSFSEAWASISAGLLTAVTGYLFSLLWVFRNEK